MDTTTPILNIKETAENAPVTLDPLQTLLAPHADSIVAFWFCVWVLTAVYLLFLLWVEYRAFKKEI